MRMAPILQPSSVHPALRQYRKIAIYRPSTYLFQPMADDWR